MAEPVTPEAPSPSAGRGVQQVNRPHVALLVDVEDWAFGHIAAQVQRHLSHRYRFQIIPVSVLDNVGQALLMTRGADLVHFFWRGMLGYVFSDAFRAYCGTIGSGYPSFKQRVIDRGRFSTAVYDHLFLDAAAIEQYRPVYREMVAGYYVSSQRLRRIYAAIEGYPPPTKVLEDGVDLLHFQPQNMERLQSTVGRDLRIGWCGNSKWWADVEDFKGVHTILSPSIAQLREEGLQVVENFADRATGTIAHSQMPGYYSTVDVYVCTSKIEGTPNPILEAMACGVPIITTDVGVVPDVLGPKQKEFILSERSVDAVKAALKRLLAAPEKLRELSEENLERIRGWDWSIKARGFETFFDLCLARDS